MKLNKKGISLIVLVITIVIIIILTAAVVLRARDENITGNAMEVVEKHNIVALKEEWNNYLAKLKTDYAAEHKKSLKISEINFEEDNAEDMATLNEAIPTLEKINLQDDFRVSAGELIYVGNDSEVKNVIKEVGDIALPYAEKKEDSKWDKPYVPYGYSIVEENGKLLNDVNEGFVIKCNSGTYQKNSEFVWVPVKSAEEYTRYAGNGTFVKMADDTTYTDSIGLAQKESIVTYGGFYIGRYESSESTVAYNTYYKYPVSVKNGSVMKIRPDSNGLEPIIEKMTYPNFNVTLVTGYMWDITCKWLYDTNDTLDDNINYFSGSEGSLYANIGNFDRTTYVEQVYTFLTGSNDKYKFNNIYDLSGNTFELTTERDASNSYYIARGGGVASDRQDLSLLSRLSVRPIYSYYGFRFALYI